MLSQDDSNKIFYIVSREYIFVVSESIDPKVSNPIFFSCLVSSLVRGKFGLPAKSTDLTKRKFNWLLDLGQ